MLFVRLLAILALEWILALRLLNQSPVKASRSLVLLNLNQRPANPPLPSAPLRHLVVQPILNRRLATLLYLSRFCEIEYCRLSSEDWHAFFYLPRFCAI